MPSDLTDTITIRVPVKLKAQLKEAAEWREMSMNKMITAMLARRVAELEQKGKL
jgi:predicted HicB family RNase H-like nuclease